MNDINLWPPFSVTVTPLNNSQACSMNSTPGIGNATAYAAGMFPVYYIPTPSPTPQQRQYSESVMSTNRYGIKLLI